jgi:serine beta-lactamase-like protein LACTB
MAFQVKRRMLLIMFFNHHKFSFSTGLSIGVTVHGRMIWKNGFGLADIEQRVPCTAETVMRIASISKIFTATIAGQFYEQGKFKWDDPIQKHRSDLPEFLFEKTPVTISMRQLASHTRLDQIFCFPP